MNMVRWSDRDKIGWYWKNRRKRGLLNVPKTNIYISQQHVSIQTDHLQQLCLRHAGELHDPREWQRGGRWRHTSLFLQLFIDSFQEDKFDVPRRLEQHHKHEKNNDIDGEGVLEWVKFQGGKVVRLSEWVGGGGGSWRGRGRMDRHGCGGQG